LLFTRLIILLFWERVVYECLALLLLIVGRLIVIMPILFVTVNITEIFAFRVRELRAHHGYSQEELAHRAGLHRTYIGAVERGERNITLLNAQRIADALGVPLAECVCVQDVNRPKQTKQRS
jgi:DNA-binding XRE family transcriptional regulator